MAFPSSDELVDIAVDLVSKALCVTELIRKTFLSSEFLAKDDRSPVTVADFASQALICRMLRLITPGIPVVAEEDTAKLRTAEAAPILDRIVASLRTVGIPTTSEEVLGSMDWGRGSPNSEGFWTLDPIDGTKGFLRGEHYAIALAFLHRGHPEVGVLGCPKLGTDGLLVYAQRNVGAFESSIKKPRTKVRLRTAEDRLIAEARLCESVEEKHSAHGRFSEVLKLLATRALPVRMDSQAKYAAVARGDADVYLRLPTRADYEERIWDHAAGALIVQESGGVVTDTFGRALDFTSGRTLAKNSGVVASTDTLHTQVLNAVLRTIPEA